jgi:hypothetical protein
LAFIRSFDKCWDCGFPQIFFARIHVLPI